MRDLPIYSRDHDERWPPWYSGIYLGSYKWNGFKFDLYMGIVMKVLKPCNRTSDINFSLWLSQNDKTTTMKFILLQFYSCNMRNVLMPTTHSNCDGMKFLKHHRVLFHWLSHADTKDSNWNNDLGCHHAIERRRDGNHLKICFWPQ